MLESAVTIVVVIFIMIAIGYLGQRMGWFGANAATVLSRVTLRVGMPALVFSNVLGNYTRAMLLEGAYSLIVPIVVIVSMYLLSGPLSSWLRIPKERRGVFRALFSFGNAVFVGMPVCRAIFGETAVPFVLFYYLVNTTLWWMIGAPNVAKDGGHDMRSPFKRLASPPLIACIISVLLVLVGFTPPKLLMDVTGYLGAMVTPLSMLFIGVTLCSMLSGGIRWQKGYGAILIGRCLIGPAICLPLCLLLGIQGDMLGVFFLQAGMPTQTQSCLWAQEHGADAGYAAGGITLSTLTGLVAIPVYTWILGFLM